MLQVLACKRVGSHTHYMHTDSPAWQALPWPFTAYQAIALSHSPPFQHSLGAPEGVLGHSTAALGLLRVGGVLQGGHLQRQGQGEV